MVCMRLGISLSATHAISSVKAGLKVSKGLTSEASALSNAYVESSVAAQLHATEASRATTKIPSSCGSCVVQESGTMLWRGAILHCVNRNVPTARIGSEQALTAQATNAG